MKKWLTCLFAAVLIVSIFSVVALAAPSDVKVTIEADPASVDFMDQSEQTLTLSVKVDTGSELLKALEFSLDFPDNGANFTYESVTVTDESDFIRYNQGNHKYAYVSASGKSGSWTLFTAAMKVKPAAAKENEAQKIGFIPETCTTASGTGNASYTPLTLTIKHAADAAHSWQPVGQSTATCTEAGTQHYTCACGAEKDENVDPLGHLNLTAGDFTFGNADGQNSNAKIHVKCDRAGCEYYGGGSGVDLTETDDEVTVTPDTKGASCGQPGKVTYTAELEITDKNTSGGKLAKTGATTVDTGEPLKHTFQPTQVVWGDGASVSGTKKCSLCGKEFTGTGTATTVTDEKPTCTTPGKSHREATLTFTPASDDSAAWNDADKTEEVTTAATPDTIPATGHALKFYDKQGGTEGRFTWTDDGKATVYVVCGNAGCDAGYAPGTDVRVETFQDGETDATCTQGGTVHYVGTISIPDPQHATGAWTLTDTHDVTSENGLGHTWEAKNIDWSGWTVIDHSFDATLKCSKCDASMTTTVTPQKDEDQSQAAGCTNPGKDVYIATANFSGKDPYGTTVAVDVPTDAKQTKENKIPALGHKWDTATATWTWDGADNVYDNTAPTAKVKVMCLNKGKCDSQYDTDGLVIDAEVEIDDTLSTVPTCTAGGEVTFKATAVTTDHFEGTEQKAETFTSSTKETYTALGHDYQGKPVVEWPASVDGTTPPTITEAKLYCAREKADVVTQATKVNEINGDPAKWADPTYQAPGKRTYTVTAQFGTGIGNEVIYVTTDEKTYELPQLEPKASAPKPEVNVTGVTVKDTPAADDIQTQVQNALQGSASGLDAKLAAELKELGDSTTSGMTVETKLVVDPKTAPTVAPVTDAGTNLAATYDIHIDVTVSDGGITGELKGNIEQTDDPISFSVPKPEGGPIYIVMRYHDGQWQTIPSAVNGNNIEFSSDRFSEFAILSSNDLKYAFIDPIPDQTYTGSEIRPAVKVTINGGTELTAGTDYTIEYADNVNVGTAAVTIKAVENGGYTGSQTVNFRIVEKPAAGGSGSGSGTKNAPATGDETPVALYAGILALSATALTVVCFRRKKSH